MQGERDGAKKEAKNRKRTDPPFRSLRVFFRFFAASRSPSDEWKILPRMQ
jgi:hypothetical protein